MYVDKIKIFVKNEKELNTNGPKTRKWFCRRLYSRETTNKEHVCQEKKDEVDMPALRIV